MPFVETSDGMNLYYKEWGAGQPLLFVHGGQLGADMWEYQMAPLAGKGLRCIAYDRRGCARSDQPGAGYDFDTLADDLAAVIAGLDLHGATLIGHSMGCGDIAHDLTRHGGERIALVATTTPCILQTADNPHGVDRAVFDATVAALGADRPRFVTALAESFFGSGLPTGSVSPELMQWGVNLALQSSPLATIAMTRAFSQTDFRPDMRSFTMPTLLIHGVADQTAPFALCGQATAKAIPGSRLEAYATGHGLFVTERERLNGDLLAFTQG